ncbi:MAG: acetylornithine transaminase [Chloroflexi bacterium]|nr:acetylornithine transaminase [Chloroflexota bacterium]
MTNWIEMEQQYYMYCARRQPIVLVRGEGTLVWDEQGKEYLDFTAGWAVNNIGHCNPAVVKAVQEQVATLLQTSNQFYTIPQLRLAKLLVEQSGLDKVFFCNSGAEANEGAIKLARKYGKLHLNGAYEIIATNNSFHGRTLAAVAATGNPHYQEPFTPMPEGFLHVDYNDVAAIQSATTDKTCAVLLEPVQGEGGVNVPSPDYLKGARQWCDERGILLILDEVQTGMGRLGTMFGYQHFGAVPDVVTLAKGLGGGVPIGAFLCKEKCNVLRPGDHGTTFGGNPLACASAYAATEYIISHHLPENAARMGERLKAGLEQVKARHEGFIKEVRGLGLLLAVEFHEAVSFDVVGACNQEGLLLNPVRPSAVRFMPPLTVTPAEVDRAVVRLERGVERFTQSRGGKNL